MKLEEGKSYQFLFIKELEVGDDLFWVLLAPDEKKYLVEALHYTKYNFNAGSTYSCKVDKINCTGKIYLEPEHPVYKLEGVYSFELSRIDKIKNSFGDMESIVVVTDIFGNEAFATIPDIELDEKSQKLDLRVDRIKKGKLYLSFPEKENGVQHLSKGEQYRFHIIGIATLAIKREYYKLRDDKGILHYIRLKFYNEGYNFRKGQFIWCDVVNEPESGKYYLEPEYPAYKKGQVYEFSVVREDFHYTTDGGKREVLIVSDKHGKECVLFYDQDINLENGATTIKARVLYSFKGKLFLRTLPIADILTDSLDF